MSPAAEPVFVIAVGASTPIGRDALSSAAAARAGITGFTEHPHMVDSTGEPIRAAIAPWLEIELQGDERFEALLFPAIAQCLVAFSTSPDPAARVALALGLPSPRPGVPPDLAKSLSTSLAKAFPGRFAAVACMENGHAAGLLGLHAASRKVAEGAFDACVVAGVESYLAPESLQWLEDNDQLHGAGRLNNAWGFIPGEAAGAVLLVREGALSRLALEPVVRVLGAGRGLEPHRIKTETVCIGEGLTAAFRDCLGFLPQNAKVTDVYCDMNGEPYRADEFGFAALRTKECFESASEFVAAADCWGDVSAASGPLGIMQATVAAIKRYAKGPYAFVWGSSETGERATALLGGLGHSGA